MRGGGQIPPLILYGRKEEDNLFGRYFTYNNASSEDFGIMLGGFSTDVEVPLGLTRDILRGSLNKQRSTPNFMGTSYADVLNFTISVVKDPCSPLVPEGEYIFTEDEIDDLASWLTAPNYPTLFHMYDDEPDVYKKYDYYAVCSDIQPMTNGEDIIGLTATFVTNSPYAWTETKTINYAGESREVTNIDVNVRTSEYNAPIYPIITINPNNDAETIDGRIPITIKNNVDNKTITLNLHRLKTIIDCQKCMIYGTNRIFTFDDIGISDVGDIYWFRLYNGANRISISGEAQITIEYREPRKVGAY